MQRRHFEIIAAIIADMRGGPYTREQIAERFAKELAHTNHQFNTSRFIEAATKDWK